MLTEEQAKFKAEWIRRLRSGEWVQITGSLGDDKNGRCCLGVAADVANNMDPTLFTEIKYEPVTGRCYVNKYYGWNTVLPDPVMKRFDLPFYPGGGIKDEELYDIDFRNHQTVLSVMNDDGMTFDQIADFIDWYWV